jgi:hypothetical protein
MAERPSFQLPAPGTKDQRGFRTPDTVEIAGLQRDLPLFEWRETEHRRVNCGGIQKRSAIAAS